ncbi:DUF4292 domain-containing protein [candidate division KSB1 bacterium]|nr:DUF4292 domain-containing protein [candidate division KSB1 bacterium]NIR68780.1 DUF4292 domain-containing protein [candidate division KSB1 bacterium]NIS28112.1 DUF4292 domain-containing protein [candidate division KSB1 bacterium]NIT75008.1 DUF4292 domain-containing protein [candidate division KSB1 bacterium]NIU28792.1 DUF4292 domain-containing protein [candidate division KSB1 bacterium]
MNCKFGCFSIRSTFLIILLQAFCLFFNCAATSKIPKHSNLTPDDIQRNVSRNFRKLETFQGRARVIIELPGSGNNGFSEVYINYPDSVYVKTEAILGIDIGALFLDSRNFGAYAPRENTLYYGEIELLDLRDFLEIELTTEELREVLIGLVQISTNLTSELGVRDGKYFITTKVAAGDWQHWVDAEKFVVTKSQLIDDAGEVTLTKEFRRFRNKEGVHLPQLVRLTRPQARERITVYYTSQKVNHRIKPKNFKLNIADNAKKVYWGDIEQPKLDRSRLNN